MGSMAPILAIISLYLSAVLAQAANLNEYPEPDEFLAIKEMSELDSWSSKNKNPGFMKRSPNDANQASCGLLQNNIEKPPRRANNPDQQRSELKRLPRPKVDLLKSLYHPHHYEPNDHNNLEDSGIHDIPISQVGIENSNSIDRPNESFNMKPQIPDFVVNTRLIDNDSPIGRSGESPSSDESMESQPSKPLKNTKKVVQKHIGAERDILHQKKILESLNQQKLLETAPQPPRPQKNCGNLAPRSGNPSDEIEQRTGEISPNVEESFEEGRSGNPYSLEEPINSRRFLAGPSQPSKPSSSQRISKKKPPPPNNPNNAPVNEHNEVGESNERFGENKPLLLSNSGKVCYSCSSLTSSSCMDPDSQRTTVKYCLKGYDTCLKKRFRLNDTDVVIRDCGHSCRDSTLQPTKTECSECYSDLCNGAFSLSNGNIIFSSSLMLILFVYHFVRPM